jgi:hypothetical protein
MSHGAPFADLFDDAAASEPARLSDTAAFGLLLLLRLSRP